MCKRRVYLFRSKNEQFSAGIEPCPYPSDNVRVPSVCKSVGPGDDEEPTALSTQEYYHCVQYCTGRALSIFGITSKCFTQYGRSQAQRGLFYTYSAVILLLLAWLGRLD